MASFRELIIIIIITDVLMHEQNLVTSGSKIIKTHTIKPPSLYP